MNFVNYGLDTILALDLTLYEGNYGIRRFSRATGTYSIRLKAKMLSPVTIQDLLEARLLHRRI